MARAVNYKSRARVFGIPLLHISRCIDPKTGKPQVAIGIIAIGRVAIGGIAIGGAAIGGLAIGGVSFGILSLGVIAVGVLGGIGGISLSLWFSLGGIAFGLHAAGVWVMDTGMLGMDVERLEFINIFDGFLSEEYDEVQ